MKMNLTGLLLAIISVTGFSQGTQTEQARAGSAQQPKTMAREQITRLHDGADMSFGALIIRSDKLVQLRDPFPYYVRTFDSLPTARNLGKVVKKMNTKLNDFYKQGI